MLEAISATKTLTIGRTRIQVGLLLDLGFLIAAFGLWAWGLRFVDPDQMTDIGLASVLPVSIWVAAGIAVVGFCVSLRPSTVGTLFPYFHLLNLVLIMHATPAITYETLRYSWAWKHLGVVDFIQRTGGIDPDATFLAAYHNWPAFFAASAFIGNLFHINSVQMAGYVRFFPVFLGFVFISVLPFLFASLTRNRVLVWTACALFLAGNWVGQDYFSPQGTSYACYIAVLALCLSPNGLGIHKDYSRLPLLGWVLSWVARETPDADLPGSHQSYIAAILVMVLTCAIVATHQLMPIVLVLALTSLTVLGRLSIGFTIFAMVAEALWLFYFAEVFISASFKTLISEFGKVGADSISKWVDYSTISAGQQIVSIASRGLTLSIGVLALMGIVRRLIEGHRDVAAVVLMGIPVVLIAINSYGGEVVFRVYLYALPFLAFFAGAVFFPSPSKPDSWIARTLLGATLAILLVGFLLANDGKDGQYRFTPYEVTAATWMYENSPDGALIIEGARNYPSQFVNYDRYTYLPISEEFPDVQQLIIADPVAVLGRWLSKSSAGGYVILTESQKAFIDNIGVMPHGSLDVIEEALLQSAKFKLAYSNRDAKIFSLNYAMPGAKDFPD